MQRVSIASVNSYVKTELRSVPEGTVNKRMQFASEHYEYSGKGSLPNDLRVMLQLTLFAQVSNMQLV